MDKLPMTQLIDIAITLVGIYSLIISLKMRSTGVINKNILAPEELAKCKDTDGFVRQIFPSMLAFSIVTVLCGIAGLVKYYLGYTARYVDFVILGVFLLAFSLFVTSLRKAREKFVNL